MVRFECQTISENIQKLKQEKFKAWMFVFKFKGIQGLSRFVRTLTYWDIDNSVYQKNRIQ